MATKTVDRAGKTARQFLSNQSHGAPIEREGKASSNAGIRQSTGPAPRPPFPVAFHEQTVTANQRYELTFFAQKLLVSATARNGVHSHLFRHFRSIEVLFEEAIRPECLVGRRAGTQLPRRKPRVLPQTPDHVRLIRISGFSGMLAQIGSPACNALWILS